MSNDVSKVTTGKPKKGGAVFCAPLGTTLPTDATSTLDEAFVGLGYCSEDGLTNSNSPSTDTVKAWGGDIVLVTESEKTDTFSFTLIQALAAEVLKVVYGDSNVTVAQNGAITVKANNQPAVAHAWVFDLKLSNNKLKRIVVPNAIISELGDITYTDEDPVGYEITLTAMPDSTLDDDTHREYLS